MPPPDDLDRFVQAQAGHIDQARAELRAGRKRTHWMWFVFPQLRGLGRSQMAWHFGITSREEAAAYLAHPVLGPRLHECVALVQAVPGGRVREIFGTPDDLKLCSCLTLFAQVAGPDSLFARALGELCDGPDAATLQRLEQP